MVAHLFAKTQDPQAALTEAAKLHSAADARIRAIYTDRLAWAARRTAYQEKVRCAYATVKSDPYASAALHRLLNYAMQQADWSSVAPVIPSLGPQPGNTLPDGLLMLALRHAHWQQAPELWQPTPGSLRQQFSAFLRHLLPGYEAPGFLDAAWFEGFSPDAEAHRDWFLHIRRGHNIRIAALPVPLTNRAAHWFLQAPEPLSIVGALRWGQMRALGGDPALAQAVAASRLARLLPDEPFWQTVLLFFAQHQNCAGEQVGPLIDYIYSRKFGEALDFRDAPEPDFSMKGRTLLALQKRMQAWYAQLPRDSKSGKGAWQPSGLPSFRFQERDPYGAVNNWTVQELTNYNLLAEEGVAMRHCVRIYGHSCIRGITSIWSLRVHADSYPCSHRVLTIEVDNARRAIVQVRGRCNRLLSAHLHIPRMQTADTMLRRWATAAGLTICCRL